MDENHEKITDENMDTEEYKIWRVLLIVSAALGILYLICTYFIFLSGGSTTSASGRFSAETMLSIKKNANTVFSMIQMPITGILAGLALFSSIRFPLKKSAVLCGIYFVVSAVLPLLSFVSSYNTIKKYSATFETVNISTIYLTEILSIIIILTYPIVILLLPRMLSKIKSEIVLFGVSTLILLVYSFVMNLLIVHFLLNKNYSLNDVFTASTLLNFFITFILMVLTFAVIRIILYWKGHNKAESMA